MSGAGLLIAAAAVVASGDSASDERFVFEPTPEAADAQKLGAPEVARAQKLAKAKRFADAAGALEALSKRRPASIHDCNLALAYLRAKAFTKAQLAWELSGLRNGDRPKWCTGEVSTELAQELRKGKYVPTSLDITPHDALVEIEGVALLRNMRTVWLEPGTPTIRVSAPGMVSQTVTPTISSPTARLAVTLEAPRPAEPDAGVALPMAADAGVADAAPSRSPDAGVPMLTSPPLPDETTRAGDSPIGLRGVALSVAVVGWVGAGVFGYLTYDAKQRANDHYATDPAFDDAHGDFDSFAVWTIGSAAVGAIATGAYVYFLTRGNSPAPGSISVGVGDGRLGVTFSGTFGGGAP